MTTSQNTNTILVLTDFSRCAQNAADYALVLAKRFKADILLFNSYFVPLSGFDTWPIKDYPALLQHSTLRLEKEAERLHNLLIKQQESFKPSIEHISDGGPVAENVSDIISQRKRILMVVMGGYRARNNDDFLSGTAIWDVLGKAKCPAVIVPECEFLQE